jgi:hypothetical protein
MTLWALALRNSDLRFVPNESAARKPPLCPGAPSVTGRLMEPLCPRPLLSKADRT